MTDQDLAMLEGFLRHHQGADDSVSIQRVASARGVYALTLGLLRRLKDRLAATETTRLTADVILFGDDGNSLHVLLIKRGWDPYEGHWALPGGHVDTGETTEDAARRELAEETGIDVGYLRAAGVYAEPGRDPRGRYVTFAYVASLDHLAQPTAADDATDARWHPVRDILGGDVLLAFDHQQIISDALAACPR